MHAVDTTIPNSSGRAAAVGPSAASEPTPQQTPAIDTTAAAPGTAAPSAPVQQPGGQQQQQLVRMCMCVEGCWRRRLINRTIGPAQTILAHDAKVLCASRLLWHHITPPTQSATGGADGPNKPGGGYFKSAPRDATHGMMEGVKSIARAYRG
jgi:hypothetical protein